MNTRQKLKEIGLDYHKIAEFFGYSSSAFANSTRRELIEKGVLKVVEYIQAGRQNKNSESTEESQKADGNCANRVLAVVTPEMEQFASEYGLFIVSVGQKYINALSPDFTTESSLEIFKREYWGRKWF